jgi:hypothetical protein
MRGLDPEEIKKIKDDEKEAALLLDPHIKFDKSNRSGYIPVLKGSDYDLNLIQVQDRFAQMLYDNCTCGDRKMNPYQY